MCWKLPWNRFYFEKCRKKSSNQCMLWQNFVAFTKFLEKVKLHASIRFENIIAFRQFIEKCSLVNYIWYRGVIFQHYYTEQRKKIESKSVKKWPRKVKREKIRHFHEIFGTTISMHINNASIWLKLPNLEFEKCYQCTGIL